MNLFAEIKFLFHVQQMLPDFRIEDHLTILALCNNFLIETMRQLSHLMIKVPT